MKRFQHEYFYKKSTFVAKDVIAKLCATDAKKEAKMPVTTFVKMKQPINKAKSKTKKIKAIHTVKVAKYGYFLNNQKGQKVELSKSDCRISFIFL